MKIAARKKELRTQMLKSRAEFSTEVKANYDRLICERLWKCIEEKEYKIVHCYLPMGTEIDFYPLIQKMLDNEIMVVIPKTLKNGILKNLVLESLAELEEGVMGTRYPASCKDYTGTYDLIIVPGLAFDRLNYRLGYGGGYYDRFLNQHPESFKLGICYPFQKVEKVPTETHDITVDEVW